MDNRYFFGEDLLEILKAKNYQDLLVVAYRVIARMKASNPNRLLAMVCGPISNGGKGSRDENLKVFGRAIKRLGNDGLLIFSQMPFEDDMVRIFNSSPLLQGEVLLEEFYWPIFSARLIDLFCFLPGWEKSVGARWEDERAKRLGIPRIYLSEYYTSD